VHTHKSTCVGQIKRFLKNVWSHLTRNVFWKCKWKWDTCSRSNLRETLVLILSKIAWFTLCIIIRAPRFQSYKPVRCKFTRSRSQVPGALRGVLYIRMRRKRCWTRNWSQFRAKMKCGPAGSTWSCARVGWFPPYVTAFTLHWTVPLSPLFTLPFQLIHLRKPLIQNIKLVQAKILPSFLLIWNINLLSSGRFIIKLHENVTLNTSLL